VVATLVDSHHVAEESLHQPSVICSTKTTETKNTEEGEKNMKKIVAILLVSLLGFLGCSDNDTTTTVDQATPVAPFGITDTTTPAYEWTPVPGATRYRLVVQDANQSSTIQDSNETYIIDEWYTAEEGECESEDVLCSVTPEIEVTGTTWKVLACAGEECGLWSETLNFEYAVMNAPRFTDNGDDTVTDNNTKLIWLKNPSRCGRRAMPGASGYCAGLTLAGYSDWRLPSISELKSLIDFRRSNPALPQGHPFINVQSYYYWSSTTYESNPDHTWRVPMNSGDVRYPTNFYSSYVWPVRSDN